MARISKSTKLKMYRNLVRTRKFDDLNIAMADAGKLLTFYHSSQGHEAIGVGGCTGLRKEDYLYVHLRGHGTPYALSKGVDPKFCIAEHLGKATGWGGGITGFHIAVPEFGIPAIAGTIGSGFVLSAGYALAAKKRGEGQVSICFTGDGGCQRGQFHEALNMAACWKLPMVWVVENNEIAWFTPSCDTQAAENVADMAKGYGIPGVIVDGMDVEAVHTAVQTAVKRARDGKGPSIVECKTYRFRSHSEGRPDISHFEPRDKKEIEAWKKKDPVYLYQEKLLKEGIIDQKLIDKINSETGEEVKAAEEFSVQSPYPDPAILPDLVYAP